MARGGGQDLPRARTLPSAKASRHGAPAKEFAPRRSAPLGKSLPTRRTSERICPRRNALLGEGLPTRRTIKRICPRRNAPLGEGLPTRHEGEGICPAQERSPRRKSPDTAHEQKNLPHARRFPSAKASRHDARAKGFAPRRNALLGESLPTQRTGERICPAGGRVHPACRRTAGRSRPTNSRKNTPSAGSHPRPRTSERICPARERSPRRRPPDTAHEQKNLPRGSSPSPHVPTNGGPPSVHRQPKNTPSAGSHPQRVRPLPSSFTEKK